MLRSALFALATTLSTAVAQLPDLYDMNTVRDVYLTFSQGNWWSQLTTNYGPEINIAATMTIDGVAYANCGVRFRGNTSYTQLPQSPNQGWEKKSFNVETDWMVAGQDVYGVSHFNFNNGFHDPLFIREPLTYYIMRRHGVAPKANWIRLHLNGTYWGVYINVEQPNKDMMKQWFRSNDGNRYRCFPTSGGFSNGRCCYTVLSPALASTYLSAYQAKQGDGTDLMAMCTTLGAMTTSMPQTTLTNVFNVDSFYRYAAVMVACQNTDSYLSSGKDHYLYIDEVHGDGSTFPFDLNEAFPGTSTTLASNSSFTTSIYRPGFSKTLIFADWTNRYKAHVRAVIEQSLNPTHLNALITQWHTMLAPHVAADSKKIYSTTLFNNNLNNQVSLGGVGGNTMSGLLPFIQARHTFLTNEAYTNATRPTLANLAHSPASPAPNQAIQFTVNATGATTVNLYWRRLGAFLKEPMFDDGLHGDGGPGDGVFGVSIAGQTAGSLVDYYVEGIAAAGGARYLPYTAECERYCPKVQIGWPMAPSVVKINEILAQNINGAVDENLQHEDWIELVNTTNAQVDISGMWLSDSVVVQKYQFPAGTTIAANGVIRIWADEDGTQGPLHANFKLSTAGELVALWDATGTILHEVVEFGPQSPDVSHGRLVDGVDPWVTFPSPTHLARNEPTSCGQRTYGAVTPSVHGMGMTVTGTLQIGTAIQYGATAGPASGVGLGALALAGAHFDVAPYGIGNEILLVDLATLATLALAFDGTGAANWSLTLPPNPSLVGARVFAQNFGLGASWDSSRAVEVMVCP